MFKPNFQLDTELFKVINDCERFYGQLESLKIPQKLELNLERDTKIQSSYISNSMEGNPLSFPEVTNLLLEDRIPANRDEKEIVNYFDILKNLNEYSSEQLTLEKILEIHRKLMLGVNDDIAGQIRNKAIVVGKLKEDEGTIKLEVKHNPPTHKKEKIEIRLNKLIEWVNKSNIPSILKAGIFHHEFVYIHPFEDGNGRTCRLLTSLILMRDGYHINKYFVLDDYYDIDRQGYSNALNSADNGEKTKWLNYFSQGCKYSLQSALSRVNTALSRLKVVERPTKREGEVIALIQEKRELTTADVVQVLGVSRQQAHNLLKGLVHKGFIKKEGSTKSSYYRVK